MTKLSKERRAEIIRRYSNGEKGYALDAEFGMSPGYSSKIAMAAGAPPLDKRRRNQLRAKQRERQVHPQGQDTGAGTGSDDVGRGIRKHN